MPRKIWNEGRVVGFSSWELYCRQVALSDPTATPADERAWLASTLTYGASLLLWVAPDSTSGPHYRDFQFPDYCRLGAANTIMASCFTGEGDGLEDMTVDGWATRVKSYGNLIENDADASPTGEVDETGTIPVKGDGTLSASTIAQIYDYVKIADGVIIQPGTWVATPESDPAISPNPAKDLQPNLTKKPRLRLSFTDQIETGFWLLLTGFTDRSILYGESVMGGSTQSLTPQNGDFIGPGVFPWCAKVLFSLPLAIVSQLGTAKYTRKLPADAASAQSVTASAIIDFAQGDPATYYTTSFTNAAVPIDVSEIGAATGSASILTAYQLDITLPPALFGVTLSSGTTGAKALGPIDIAAPGTVKVYPTPVTADAYESNTPYCVGMYRDADLIVYEVNPAFTSESEGRFTPLSDDKTTDMAGLYMYNARNLWFYGGVGGGQPTVAEMQAVKNIRGTRIIKGHVSQSFVDTYCVSYSVATAACRENHIGTIQSMYITELVDKYGQTYVQNNYKFFFHTFYPTLSGASTEGMFFPVNINDNSLSFGTKLVATMNATHGFNFSTSSTTIESVTQPAMNVDYLGTMNNAAQDGSAYYSDGTTLIFTGHPLLKNTVKDYDTQWYSGAAVPKAPASYSDQFINWFSATKLTDIVASSQSDATAVLTAMGIHSDYHNMDLQSFMQCAATERDMSKSLAEIASTNAYLHQATFFYKATDITAIADDSFTWTGHTYTAGVHVKADLDKNDFYRMAKIHMYVFTMSGDQVQDGADVTNQYADTNYHIWASEGQSGLHHTSSISLIDGSGSPLPTSGTAGKVNADDITWIDLLDGLNQNKAVNILGDVLKGLKVHLTDSGNNYLEFANGLRLYVATSAPQDANIPEGSVGIGW